jgi:hypothetical protein
MSRDGADDEPQEFGHESYRLGGGCAFRGVWAVISGDFGHAFHGISGSHFTDVGRLVDTCH